MHIKAVKTAPISLGEEITKVLDNYLPPLVENTIIAIASKIISLSQNRILACADVANKNGLIKKEADAFIADEYNNGNVCLTIKNNILVPFAGVDESNGNNHYILYPLDIQQTAAKIWQYLRTKNNISNLGIIITDSNITALRRGVTGVAIGYYGFEPLYNYVGKLDIFGKTIKMTYINNLDALAAAAVLVMGEGNESTPIAIITDAPRIEFSSTSDFNMNKISMPIGEDFYSPILRTVRWIWNRR
ncbi:Coenzyme F420:L-glutamate ligase family protein [Candidatus Trichorickettsia mobilis]|uniref:Coenzyme F420:L-glutamate ligase family protein n=1 Tax=Candidatus Trichorickettsia mobilis TaxID=1346319 RepID=A0ABZ0UT67_9RICK|nr:coenzyme F420-0:L-glutamate ligase [Candidatus Trichorickettsia mobilis]WPY00158.1 Coenzyme F420:L-glutamate ligase family protein [Candidatus Trichorickettsia mobilis]